jgi:hypothetical protein
MPGPNLAVRAFGADDLPLEDRQGAPYPLQDILAKVKKIVGKF